MDDQHSRGSPFSERVLQRIRDDTSHPAHHASLDSLLPASYRAAVDRLPRVHTPNAYDIAFLEQELDLHRLSSIFAWLWVAGRPMPPRPLHHQLVLGREIFVAERMDLHLVWTTGRVFLKPIPRFLLEPAFWSEHLSCRQGRVCSEDIDDSCRQGVPLCRQRLRATALGFLFSYIALIGYESDFLIAKEKHLLPREVEWLGWKNLVREILEINDIDQKINVRFIYGELRLSRLNKIYMLSRRPFLRGYMPSWQQYGAYFRDNLGWLTSATVYIAVVLTAMQVGLATSLAGNVAFQSASYGFTIFSIIGPLIAAALIVLVFLCVFVDNWMEAERYKKKVFRAIQRGPGGL